MDTNETDRNGTGDGRDRDDPGAQESPALGPFVHAVGECAELLARIKERVDDHLGVSPEDVALGHAEDAQRLAHRLRHAAFAAGIGEEPRP